MQKTLLMGILFSISILQSQAPNWSVNSANFSLDASIVGVLKFNNQTSTNTNDMVAVFDENNTIRGVANVSFNAALNKHLVFISIHSNSQGDKLTFKAYNASEDKVYEASTTTINFTPNVVLGNATSPFEILADNVLNTQKFNTNVVAVYPNPAKKNITISSHVQLKSVKIFSILGKQIRYFKIFNNNPTINISTLNKGIYLLRLETTDDNIITRKFIKK